MNHERAQCKANDLINSKTPEELERIIKSLTNAKDDHQILIAEKIKEQLNKDNKPFDLQVAEYWIHLRKSALTRNKEFNLEFKDVEQLMLVNKCAYTNCDLVNETRTTDRFDNNKGYVKGNVFAVSKRANQLKNILFENNNSKMRMRMSIEELKCFVGVVGVEL